MATSPRLSYSQAVLTGDMTPPIPSDKALAEIYDIVMSFAKANDGIKNLYLTSRLSSAQRGYAHILAEHLQLRHQTIGHRDGTREIKISKVEPPKLQKRTASKGTLGDNSRTTSSSNILKRQRLDMMTGNTASNDSNTSRQHSPHQSNNSHQQQQQHATAGNVPSTPPMHHPPPSIKAHRRTSSTSESASIISSSLSSSSVSSLTSTGSRMVEFSIPDPPRHFEQLNFYEQILAFYLDDKQTVLDFPSTLTRTQRKMVRNIASQFLMEYSNFLGPVKAVRITKPNPSETASTYGWLVD
jgi:hypothetical protein